MDDSSQKHKKRENIIKIDFNLLNSNKKIEFEILNKKWEFYFEFLFFRENPRRGESERVLFV